MKTQDVLPVVISVIVIILIAILEKQSRLIAAITATMPLGIPLAIWIVHSSSRGDQTAVSEFTLGTLLGIIPTIGFVITAWLVARNGASLGKILISGYSVWGLGALIMVFVRKFLIP
ncbi:MAG TPA: hypothetical protein VLA32_09880 [Anaerolineales bacterium]|jgi:hypothetical protein|nr:hypothetical protein [Anaerolineales bacterium]